MFTPPVLTMPRTRNDPSIRQTFRLYSKTFFLTYSQCELDKTQLADLLGTKGKIIKMAIGRETHEDGNHHLHAIVQYEKKVNVRDERFFDLEGHHPSIESPRNIQASINYCCKEDTNPLLLDCTTEIHADLDLYQLARDTPENEYFETCRKKKVSIHSNLGELFVCRSGIQENTTRTLFEHDHGDYRSQWDYFIRSAADNAISAGLDFSLDQRTEWDWKDDLGTPLRTETCTIRETSGYTTRIQKWIPQLDHLRRYVLQPSSTPSTNRHSRPISPAASAHSICSSLPSSWYPKDLSVK